METGSREMADSEPPNSLATLLRPTPRALQCSATNLAKVCSVTLELSRWQLRRILGLSRITKEKRWHIKQCFEGYGQAVRTTMRGVQALNDVSSTSIEEDAGEAKKALHRAL